MDIQTTTYDGKATLRLKGRFQFDSHREFRSAYEPYIADPAMRVVVVDFSGVDYLDSSALGMLLLLREKLMAVRKEREKLKAELASLETQMAVYLKELGYE